jgi:hypothetical protein
MRIVTLLVLPVVMFPACAAWPWDACGATERAVLAEFPLYGNVAVAPEFNPKHPGCVLAYSTTDSPEQVLAYFTEQLEAHNWQGVPHFASGEHELSAYRERLSYGVRVGEGQIGGQALPPGASILSVVVEERPDRPIPGYEPNADVPSIEMSQEELAQFTGEFGSGGRVEAVFRIKDFSDLFLVEFDVADGEVKGMTIEQQFTGLHAVGGTMSTHVELVPVQ